MKIVKIIYHRALSSDDYFILFHSASCPSLRARNSFDPKLWERQESSRSCSSREDRGSLAYRKRALLFKRLLFPHSSDLNISLSPSFDSCLLACNEAPSCWNTLRELREKRVIFVYYGAPFFSFSRCAVLFASVSIFSYFIVLLVNIYLTSVVLNFFPILYLRHYSTETKRCLQNLKFIF